MRRAFFVFLFLYASANVFGQQINLLGFLKTDAGAPIADTPVSVAGGQAVRTDLRGQFKITLSNEFKEGERVKIIVSKPNWVINSPLDGEWNLPNLQLQNIQTLNVIIVQKGSKVLWTHARIEKYVAKLSDEIVRLKKEVGKPLPVDFSAYINQWAKEYGFTPEEVKAAFDEWAKVVENAEDYKTIGLREFYKKNFAAAAASFDKAALKSTERVKQSENQLKKDKLEAYENYLLAGNARMALEEFGQALNNYVNAETYVSRLDNPLQWGELKSLIGVAKLAITDNKELKEKDITELESEVVSECKQALSVLNPENSLTHWTVAQMVLGHVLRLQAQHAPQAEGLRLLDEVVTVADEILRVYSQKRSSEEWAMTQAMLGDALHSQGKRLEGSKGEQLFGDAVKAYQAALRGYMLEQFPKRWAEIQEALGDALYSQGKRLEGSKGEQLFGDAVKAYQAALRVNTLEQFPKDWAGIQRTLGQALMERGTRVEGVGRERLLAEAVKTLNAALTVPTSPQILAVTQHTLGLALCYLGQSKTGVERVRLLTEAVKVLQAALNVRTPEHSLQNWAKTQHTLGFVLGELGHLTTGAERVRLLDEAVKTLRAALTAYTPEQFPQDWAGTQYNLALALYYQGERTTGRESVRVLSEAATILRAVLPVQTDKSRDWARTQLTLGNVLRSQGEQSEGIESAKLLGEAVTAYQAALTIHTQEQLQEAWAETQFHLGNTMSMLGNRAMGAASAELFVKAIKVYRAALTVYTRERFPQRWANIHYNLGLTLWEQSVRIDKGKRAVILDEAVTAFEAALSVYKRDQYPGPWAKTQFYLGRVYEDLQNWQSAAVRFEKVLAINHEDEVAAGRLASIYHSRLYEYSKAFEFNLKWLTLLPQSTTVHPYLAESYFTTGHFTEYWDNIKPLLVDSRYTNSHKISLLMIFVANLLALDKTEDVLPVLNSLREIIAVQQEDFRIKWLFNGTLHFINHHEKFVARRNWLNQFFSIAVEKKRDAILKALDEAMAKFQ